MDAVKEPVVAQAQAVVESAQAVAEQVAEQAHAVVGQVAEHAQQVKKQLASQVEQLHDQVEQLQEVLEQPIASVEFFSFFLKGRPFLGLFVQAPSWPPKQMTVRIFLRHNLFRALFVVLLLLAFVGGTLMLLSTLPLWLPLAMAAPLVTLGGVHKVSQSRKQFEDNKAEQDAGELDWRKDYRRYFSTRTLLSQQRRHEAAVSVLDKVQVQHAKAFNEHVKEATSLAVYGCGILAAIHVGGLAALEKHGLQYSRIKTLAGVSAGSVVVAMVAVGYRAEELFELIKVMPFPQIAYPELGAVLRVVGNAFHALILQMFGATAAAAVQPLAIGHGPGMTSGDVLEEMIAQALEAKCKDRDISLRQVLDRFGKRLVIIVCELDSGCERQLTPETEPDLPLRVAVRMSMGVPGIMEPFSYNGHVYCDGGMCNDFPMNALPEGKRIGLMVRNMQWIEYHMRGWQRRILSDEVYNEVGMDAALKEHSESLHTAGLYPVKSPLDLMMTCCNVMMDANLILQVRNATLRKDLQQEGFAKLAPEIMTLNCGNLDPFNFNLTKEQHRDLYEAGQLCVHMHAMSVDGCDSAMLPPDDILKAIYLLHGLD